MSHLALKVVHLELERVGLFGTRLVSSADLKKMETLHSEINLDKRIVWADIARVLAIFFIVEVHTSNSLSIFPRLGVPLFIMLSGMMLLPKNESYSKFWSKRLLRLLRPWVFWSVIVGMIDVLLNKTPLTYFFSYFKVNFATSWFMPVIFGLYLLTPALRILVKSAKVRDMWFLIVLWFISLSILPFFRNTLAFPLFINNGYVEQLVQLSGYFILGLAIVRQNWWGKTTNLILIIMGFLLTALLSASKPVFLSYPAPGIVILACGFFGLLSNFGNYFQKIFSGKPNMFLAAVSKTSLGVYFIHLQIVRLLPLKNYFRGWAGGVFLFCLSFLLILLLQKVPLLKRWVA